MGVRSVAWSAILLAVGLAAVPGPSAAGEGPASGVPFAGIGPLEVGRAADLDAARLERLAGMGRALLHAAPLAWGDVEPAAPRAGTPHYTWQALDDAVLYWQLSGFDPVLVLNPRSPWAAAKRAGSGWLASIGTSLSGADADAALRTATGAAALRKDTWPLWERFVRELVERYDGDGKADLPGLRRPVRYIQVLSRAVRPDVWIGNDDEYLRLLHHAGLGAKAASSECRVLATGIDLMGTGYEPHPDEREWAYRIDQRVPKDARLARLLLARRFSLIRRLLEAPQLYDVLPQLGSDNLVDDVANLRFLRRSLDENRGSDVSVWLVDNPPRKLGPAQSPGDVAPKNDERRARRRWLPVARNPAHSEHAQALAWMRRGQAFDVVRSLARSRAAGADAVLFLAPADELPAHWPHRTAREGLGFLDRARRGGANTHERTASWYALRQALRLLGGHRSAGETALGAPGRSVVFHFERKQERPWVVVLLLDARLSWAGQPGAALPQRDVLIALPDGDYVLESCRLGAEEPVRKTVTVTGGSLVVTLTPAPLYVLPKRR